MQTDIDPETLTVSTGFKLSSPAEATLSRSWIARLRGQVRSSLAASTGVETADDVAAYLLAGADAVMTTSAPLRHGPGHVTALLDGLTAWMGRKGAGSVAEIRGLLAGATPPAARAVRLPQRGRAGDPGPFLPVALVPGRGPGTFVPTGAGRDQPMFDSDELNVATSFRGWPKLPTSCHCQRIPLLGAADIQRGFLSWTSS